jgi:hypothetical protein
MSDLLNSASLVMIPSGYKEDVVYSQIPTDGSGDLSFTRASNGTRINSAGLVEEVRTNIALYSEDQTAWTDQNETSVTANAAANPLNGAVTADKVIPSANTADHYRGLTMGNMVGEITSSIYVKADGYTIIDYGVYNTNAANYPVRAVFDLSTETITQINGSISSITSVGSGWYRISISASVASTGSMSIYHRVRSTGTSGNYAGNGTSGMLLWGAQLETGVLTDYIPTTSAAVSVGMTANVPRLTYPVGGGCPSLLLEKQSTNLALQSNAFNTSPWVGGSSLGSNPVITPNYGISPDGTQNAVRIELARTNVGTSYSQIYQYPINVTIGQSYTWSVWLKSLSGTPTISIIGDFGRPPVTLTSEWVRYTGTATAIASQTQLEIAILGSTYATGNSLSADFLAYGYQLEASSYHTTYIPTTSSSATRVADACFKTGISSLIGQSEGVVFWDIEVETLSATGNENILNIDDGTGFGNTIYFIKGSTGILSAEVYVTGVAQCSFSYSLPSVGRYKMALAYASNDFAFYVNGVSRGTDSSGTVPATSRFQMGNSVFGPSDGKINQAILFPTRLTNAELQALTA